MRIGKIEGQVVALYVRPGTCLSVAPEFVETMRAHARENGAIRLIAGSQRGRNRAFERLGARRVADLYEIDVKGAA
jgi:hypothetical protein